MMWQMPVVAVGVCALALAAATALCFGLTAIGQRLGALARPDRVTRADRRWLADQDKEGPEAR